MFKELFAGIVEGKRVVATLVIYTTLKTLWCLVGSESVLAYEMVLMEKTDVPETTLPRE